MFWDKSYEQDFTQRVQRCIKFNLIW